jgi:hypothetical protein
MNAVDKADASVTKYMWPHRNKKWTKAAFIAGFQN